MISGNHGSSSSLPPTATLSGTLVIGDKMDSSSQEDTLEDVYVGLKDWRWAESSEDMWDMVEDGGEYLDPDIYFVTYKRKQNGNFGIHGSTEEYPGKKCERDFWRAFLENLNKCS